MTSFFIPKRGHLVHLGKTQRIERSSFINNVCFEKMKIKSLNGHRWSWFR